MKKTIKKKTHKKTQKLKNKKRKLSPTRYGDWEIKGRCIDF